MEVEVENVEEHCSARSSHVMGSNRLSDWIINPRPTLHNLVKQPGFRPVLIFMQMLISQQCLVRILTQSPLSNAIWFLATGNWISFRAQHNIPLLHLLPPDIAYHCRPRRCTHARSYITKEGSQMRSVPIESAKQLEFKMKFMGLVVVALVVLLSIISPATSAPAPVPVPAPKPITPALATALGAAAGDLAVAGASIPAVPVLLASSLVPAGALSSILTSGVIPAKIVLAKGAALAGLGAAGLAATRSRESSAATPSS